MNMWLQLENCFMFLQKHLHYSEVRNLESHEGFFSCESNLNSRGGKLTQSWTELLLPGDFQQNNYFYFKFLSKKKQKELYLSGLRGKCF